ncbi:MAG: PilN domain-containing protein [Proteobacteria bacterium]|nr:PilN domain-containing protein [Pseudomonadota bacterium]
MIVRINLHPDRKPKVKPSPYQGIIGVAGVFLVIELIVCFVLFSSITEQAEKATQQERQLRSEVSQLESRLTEVPKIQTQIQELRTRELTLARLAAFRTGPQYILNELARIMSNPRDVVARKAAADAEWALTWDPDNVMIHSFKDIGNGQIKIDGRARSMDDISEFWKRLKTSPMLRNVRLGEIKDSREASLDIVTQTFTFTAEANFNYQTKDGLALIDLLTREEAQSPDTSVKN